MNKINTKWAVISLVVAIVMAAATSCTRGRTTVIKNSDGNSYQKIEYTGRVVFNKENNGIEHISKGGHLFFDRNGEEFEAHPDKNGNIKYSFDGDDEVNTLSESQKAFVKEAIAIITKERARLNASRN
jgi:hypothetical protein